MTLTFHAGEYVVIMLKDQREFRGVVWYGTSETKVFLNSGAHPPHIFHMEDILSVSRPIKEEANA